VINQNVTTAKTKDIAAFVEVSPIVSRICLDGRDSNCDREAIEDSFPLTDTNTISVVANSEVETKSRSIRRAVAHLPGSRAEQVDGEVLCDAQQNRVRQRKNLQKSTTMPIALPCFFPPLKS
jgi:hypothetical protein